MQHDRRHRTRQEGRPELQRDLSRFLIGYLAMLLGVLLGVHLLQAALQHPPAGTTQSPAHQQHVTVLKHAVAASAAAR